MQSILNHKNLLRVFLLMLITGNTGLSGQNLTLPLWEQNIPNYVPSGEVEIRDSGDIVSIRKVQTPLLDVYLPSRKNSTGDAIVICPGGGYWILAYDWEGSDIAKYLNAKGIAAIVLKYRLPTSSSQVVPHLSPLMDAQRAMRLVRYHAADWKINPGRIGIMGFSAGGHLASSLSTHHDQGDPGNIDPVERISCRPDFSILIYPVITFTEDFRHNGSREALIGKDPSPELIKYYSSELQVKSDTPPAILIHSLDDTAVPVENSLVYFEALRKYNITSSLHVYPYGGHGYSLAIGKGYLSTWPERVVEWVSYLNLPIE